MMMKRMLVRLTLILILMLLTACDASGGNSWMLQYTCTTQASQQDWAWSLIVPVKVEDDDTFTAATAITGETASPSLPGCTDTVLMSAPVTVNGSLHDDGFVLDSLEPVGTVGVTIESECENGSNMLETSLETLLEDYNVYLNQEALIQDLSVDEGKAFSLAFDMNNVLGLQMDRVFLSWKKLLQDDDPIAHVEASNGATASIKSSYCTWGIMASAGGQ